MKLIVNGIKENIYRPNGHDVFQENIQKFICLQPITIAFNRVGFYYLFRYNIDSNLTIKGENHIALIIRPSSELRKNDNSIVEICRKNKTPAFLTRNGEGDMVLMDMETYSRREEELVAGECLLATEQTRFEGTCGYTIEEFSANMRDAIKKGASRHES